MNTDVLFAKPLSRLIKYPCLFNLTEIKKYVCFQQRVKSVKLPWLFIKFRNLQLKKCCSKTKNIDFFKSFLPCFFLVLRMRESTRRKTKSMSRLMQ